LRVERKKGLKELLKEFEAQGFDFVLVEGFKNSDLPKILVGEFDGDLRGVVVRVDSEDVRKDVKVKEVLRLFLSSDIFEMSFGMEEKRCEDEQER